MVHRHRAVPAAHGRHPVAGGRRGVLHHRGRGDRDQAADAPAALGCLRCLGRDPVAARCRFRPRRVAAGQAAAPADDAARRRKPVERCRRAGAVPLRGGGGADRQLPSGCGDRHLLPAGRGRYRGGRGHRRAMGGPASPARRRHADDRGDRAGLLERLYRGRTAARLRRHRGRHRGPDLRLVSSTSSSTRACASGRSRSGRCWCSCSKPPSFC